jgi:uncharacterized membrane protein
MGRKYTDIVVACGVAIFSYATAAKHLPFPVMLVCGILLFVLPGYIWAQIIAADRSSRLERAVVSVGIALLVPVFGGLALSAANVRLDRHAWTTLLGAATLAGAVVLALRRRKLDVSVANRRDKGTRTGLPGLHLVAYGTAAVIATGAVALAVAGAHAQKYPGYTQLWLSPLVKHSLAADLGVTNQQGSTVNYRLMLIRNGKVSNTWNLELANNQTWQHTISFTTNYPITAKLYRLPDLSHPYRSVDNGA